MKPGGGRVKGHAFERDMVRRFRQVFGDDCRRGLQGAGAVVADVEVPVLWIECKRGKKTNIKRGLDQAVADAPKGRIPICVSKDDRKQPLVTLQLEDFLEILTEWWRDRQ